MAGVLFNVLSKLVACLYRSLSESVGDEGKLRKISTSFSMLKYNLTVIAAEKATVLIVSAKMMRVGERERGATA